MLLYRKNNFANVLRYNLQFTASLSEAQIMRKKCHRLTKVGAGVRERLTTYSREALINLVTINKIKQ